MDGMATSTAMDMGASSTMSMAASATSSSMDMDSSMGGCQISMLWNWNTIDSCFISSSWHVTSRGMFAGSCIGVVFLVLALEFLRRSVKEFDRYLIKQHTAKYQNSKAIQSTSSGDTPIRTGCVDIPAFRPNVFQQAVRAFLHMLQFAVAYFIMLLAMYYNGYIIICIFIGAFLGSFIFQWEQLNVGTTTTSAASEATVCCG